jgi:hypothetical protein
VGWHAATVVDYEYGPGGARYIIELTSGKQITCYEDELEYA